MTATDNRISAHEAVERLLAAKATEDPNFVHRLLLDPKAEIQPLLASAMGDDTLDLSDVSGNVNFETGSTLQFTVPLAYDQATEVAGFADLPGTMDMLPPVYRRTPCDYTVKAAPPVGSRPTDSTMHPALCVTKDEEAGLG